MPRPDDPDRLPELPPELEEHLFGEVPEQTKPVKILRVAVDRKEIKVGPDTLRIVDESIEAISRDPRTFARANELVTVIGAPPDLPRTPLARGTPIIRPIEHPTLAERLSAFARYIKKKEDGWVETTPPPVAIGAILKRGDWRGVRPLLGVTETPIFRSNGTIRQERGYDPETGYLYLPSADYPNVPDSPTQADARKALADLEHVFCDFQHVDRSHKMVPIAAILTILARSAIDGSVPAFLFDASTRGSGKTLQADVVHLVAFGRSAARKTYPDEDDELEKVLSSYAIAGSRCILLDNVTRTFGGGPIDLCISARDDVELRVLGKSEIRRLPWQAIIMVSGNNLSLVEDTMRRVLIARIESDLENPESRTGFAHADLVRWVRAERSRLVAAALTILRAYAVVGYPDAGCPVWGTFEAWSRLIPHAIVFAGGADPMAARPRVEDVSDEMMAVRTIHRELERLSTGDQGMTVKQILAALYPSQREHDDAPDGWEDFRDAIEQLVSTRPGSKPSGRALGDRFRKHKGRVLSGKRLSVVDGAGHAGSKRWRIERA